jgi:Tubulin binding cofactor C
MASWEKLLQRQVQQVEEEDRQAQQARAARSERVFFERHTGGRFRLEAAASELASSASPVPPPSSASAAKPKDSAEDVKNKDISGGGKDEDEGRELQVKMVRNGAALWMGQLSDCRVAVGFRPSKLLLDNCDTTTFVIEEPIVTGTLEINRCRECVVVCAADVPTVQIDMSTDVEVRLVSGSRFDVWINRCERIRIRAITSTISGDQGQSGLGQVISTGTAAASGDAPSDLPAGPAAGEPAGLLHELDMTACPTPDVCDDDSQYHIFEKDGRLRLEEVKRETGGYIVPTPAEEARMLKETKSLAREALESKADAKHDPSEALLRF